MREYRRIEGPTPLKEGMMILAGRLGLSWERIRRLARDRHPSPVPKEERHSRDKFRCRCFLRSDIIFTDVLHTGYEELRHVGLGRWYLTCRILRAVVAGTCDYHDRSGQAGDFPPRSWMDSCAAERMKDLQERCLREVRSGEPGLMKSIQVRLRRVATPALMVLADSSGMIRSAVRRRLEAGTGSGLRCLSDILIASRKNLFTRARYADVTNRTRRRQVRSQTRRDRRSDVRSHNSYSLLKRGLNDLRKLMDPAVPCWWRRPTDEDWSEGMAPGRQRRPVSLSRGVLMANHGFGEIPGLCTPLSADDWGKVRTDWTVAEARALKLKKGDENGQMAGDKEPCADCGSGLDRGGGEGVHGIRRGRDTEDSGGKSRRSLKSRKRSLRGLKSRRSKRSRKKKPARPRYPKRVRKPGEKFKVNKFLIPIPISAFRR